MDKNSRLEGFTLVEISIVLLIIGVIAGGMMKGKDLLESARINSVVSDVQNFRVAYAEYTNLYGVLPGDDSGATGKFKGVSDGDGDGKTSSSDAKNVFPHLKAAGLIPSQIKNPKIGGSYDVVSENDETMLRISKAGSPFLTNKQATKIVAKMKGEIGDIKVLVSPEISSDLSQKYIVMINLD